MMTEINQYQIAYERERQARKLAEKLLDEKTRSLYDNCLELASSVSRLEAMQEQLVQSEKMASIGQLAAGVAHEINNPIGFSLSNMSTLREYLDSFLALDKIMVDVSSNRTADELIQAYQDLRVAEDIDFVSHDVKTLLDDTLNGLNRVSKIVANLKTVSYSGSAEKTLCNINKVIDESLKLVWNELKYSFEIEKEYSSLPEILCFESEIHQVLMNMLLNAAHACGEAGCIKLKTHKKVVENRSFIAIEISDNGKGMSKSTVKKIFDPFYTTKPVGIGTGLGLYISFGIIEKHQGKIEVSSEEGKGTTFTIYLPIE